VKAQSTFAFAPPVVAMSVNQVLWVVAKVFDFSLQTRYYEADRSEVLVPRNNHPGLMYWNLALFVCRDLTTACTLRYLISIQRTKHPNCAMPRQEFSGETEGKISINLFSYNVRFDPKACSFGIRPREFATVASQPPNSTFHSSITSPPSLIPSESPISAHPKPNPSKYPITISLASTG